MFQILGSIGEYEKGVITARMTLARDRVARTGEWLIATVPLGYDVIDGRLAPSERLVQGAAVTEADLVREIFERIAGGSTTVAEARRLNTLGTPSQKRTLTKVERDGGIWRPDRIRYTIRNTAYRRRHTINSGHGRVERDVVPLVSPELWQAANERPTKNRSRSTKNAKRSRPKTTTIPVVSSSSSLFREINVTTEGTGYTKTATVVAHYVFGEAHVVAADMIQVVKRSTSRRSSSRSKGLSTYSFARIRAAWAAALESALTTMIGA